MPVTVLCGSFAFAIPLMSRVRAMRAVHRTRGTVGKVSMGILE